MDRLTISSAGGLGADYQGLANLKRRAPRAEEEAFAARLGEPQPDGAKDTPLEDKVQAASAPASAVAKDLGQDLPRLNRRQAREMLQGLALVITQTQPWKLAEIQAVSERSLIPSAYV